MIVTIPVALIFVPVIYITFWVNSIDNIKITTITRGPSSIPCHSRRYRLWPLLTVLRVARSLG